MLKFAKIEDATSKLVCIGAGTDSAFYESIGMELMDVEQAYNGAWYVSGYTPLEPEIAIVARVRAERDRRITACAWIIMRHRDEIDEGNDTTLTTGEYAVWLAYRKNLRNLPSVGDFPWDGRGEDTPWPVEPEHSVL